MKQILLALWLLPFLCGAQSRHFTLASYNSLRYSPQNIDQRHPDYRIIMNTMRPDILVLEELPGSDAAIMFMDSVLNIDSTTYSEAPFIDGNDLDVALFYKSAKFQALPTVDYPTDLRSIFHFRLIPTNSQDTLHVFGLHLKASSGSTNETRRDDEIKVLRNVTDNLPQGSNFLVCGDFNIYKSSEPAYQRLLNNTGGTNGYFIDKITMTGTWNNAAYAQYHTQSPRTTQFNGGASGGMDDRFDLILLSQALDSAGGISYIPGSMKAFGNDGQHYNKAITDSPADSVVSAAVAQALHYASDHIPVIASFEYTPSYVGLPAFTADSQLSLYNSSEAVRLKNPENRKVEIGIYTITGQLIKKMVTSNSVKLPLDRGIFLIQISEPHTHQLLLVQKVLL